MSNGNGNGVVVQPWVWAVLLSLFIQICGAVYITATVISKVDAIGGRVQRIENQIDHMFNQTRGLEQ